jgi:hypothetical protein
MFLFKQKLETLLPPKPKVEIPTGDHVDEVSMVDYESTKGSSKSTGGGGARGFREAYSGDDDDDDEPAGQRVECNTH